MWVWQWSSSVAQLGSNPTYEKWFFSFSSSLTRLFTATDVCIYKTYDLFMFWQIVNARTDYLLLNAGSCEKSCGAVNWPDSNSSFLSVPVHLITWFHSMKSTDASSLQMKQKSKLKLNKKRLILVDLKQKFFWCAEKDRRHLLPEICAQCFLLGLGF